MSCERQPGIPLRNSVLFRASNGGSISYEATPPKRNGIFQGNPEFWVFPALIAVKTLRTGAKFLRQHLPAM
jgi:hypothetical protein